MYQGGYYHIIHIGMVFEKDRESGLIWKKEDKNRLKDECELWQKMMELSEKEDQAAAEKEAVSLLSEIIRKYKLPDYERIIELIPQNNGTGLEFPEEEFELAKKHLQDMIGKIDGEIELGNRKDAYTLLRKAHNIPRYFYHEDVFGKGGGIRFEDVLEWSR